MSQQSEEFAEYLRAQRERLGNPDLDIQTIRDVIEAMHVTAEEPEGVTYAEDNLGGIPALWCIPAGIDHDAVLLHSHMGGSIVGSMHSERKVAAHIAKAAGVTSVIPNYRLAPEHKFPAQIDDMESAYLWLLNTGRRARDIALVGVSVGGNLAVNLALRQRNRGGQVPAAVLAVSPWVDPAMTNETLDTHAQTDAFLNRQFLELFRTLWLEGSGVNYDDAAVNLLAADLNGLPPLSVYYGTEEMLAGEAQEFTRRAQRAGVEAAAHPVLHGQHGFVSGAGRIPEVDAAITEMGGWLRRALVV